MVADAPGGLVYKANRRFRHVRPVDVPHLSTAPYDRLFSGDRSNLPRWRVGAYSDDAFSAHQARCARSWFVAFNRFAHISRVHISDKKDQRRESRLRIPGAVVDVRGDGVRRESDFF